MFCALQYRTRSEPVTPPTGRSRPTGRRAGNRTAPPAAGRGRRDRIRKAARESDGTAARETPPSASARPRSGARSAAGCAGFRNSRSRRHRQQPVRRGRARRGARLFAPKNSCHGSQFQLTRPARGATKCTFKMLVAAEISTHAPRAGRDVPFDIANYAFDISTHAPRAGRDYGNFLFV